MIKVKKRSLCSFSSSHVPLNHFDIQALACDVAMATWIMTQRRSSSPWELRFNLNVCSLRLKDWSVWCECRLEATGNKAVKKDLRGITYWCFIISFLINNQCLSRLILQIKVFFFFFFKEKLYIWEKNMSVWEEEGENAQRGKRAPLIWAHLKGFHRAEIVVKLPC